MGINDWLQGTNNKAADGYAAKPGNFRVTSREQFRKGVSKTSFKKIVPKTVKFGDKSVDQETTYKLMQSLIKKRGYLNKDTLNKDLQKMGVKQLDRKRFEKVMKKHFDKATVDPEAEKRALRFMRRNVAISSYERDKGEINRAEQRGKNAIKRVLSDETGTKKSYGNTLGIQDIEKSTSVLQAGQKHAPTMFAKKEQHADDYKGVSSPTSVAQMGSSKVIGKPGAPPNKNIGTKSLGKPGGPPPSSGMNKSGGIKLAA